MYISQYLYEPDPILLRVFPKKAFSCFFALMMAAHFNNCAQVMYNFAITIQVYQTFL